MIVYQGDQYAIPFIIRIGRTLVTPENVDDVRIEIGSDLRSYLDETIDFDSEKGSWNYFVTEDFTRSLSTGSIPFQIGIKMGDTVRHSAKGRISLDDNIIKVEWFNE